MGKAISRGCAMRRSGILFASKACPCVMPVSVAPGATLFTVGTSGPDYDLALVREWVAWRDAQG